MQMKKILYTLIGIGCLVFASCDMDKYPYDKIPTDEALQTASDFENFRNGFYAYVRGQFTGDFVLQPEIQAEDRVHTPKPRTLRCRAFRETLP